MRDLQHLARAIPKNADQNMAIGNNIACNDFTEYLPEVLNMAEDNYDRFSDMSVGTSSQQQIYRSSLTVAGWVACDVWE